MSTSSIQYLSKEQVSEFSEIFHRMCTEEGDEKVVNTNDLGRLLLASSLSGKDTITEVEKQELIVAIDKNQLGWFTLDQFLRFMDGAVTKIDCLDELKEAFNHIDYKGDGYITVETLRQFLEERGESNPDPSHRDYITERDMNLIMEKKGSNGRITFEQFYAMLMK